MNSQTAHRTSEVLVLALVYFIVARFSLLLALPPGYATPIWPAAGIALAAVLILGNRVAPAIWLGSFLANTANSVDVTGAPALLESLLVPAGLGVASMLQALAGAFAIRRLVGFPSPLDQPRDVINFLALGGPVCCVVGASVGVATLVLAGKLPAGGYAFHWWAWWIGDATGVLIATPLVLTWFGEPREIWRRRQKTFAIPIFVTFLVILGVFAAGTGLFAAPQTWVAWFVLAGGMAFTGVLGAFLLVMSGHVTLCEQLVVERTKALEQTRQAEQAARLLSAIVTSTDDAVIGETLDGTVVCWNASAERMYGYSASEMVGRSVTLLAPPELAAEMPCILQRLKAGQRVEHLETVRVRKDGRRIDVSMTISPIHDGEGRVAGASAIVRDISDRRRAEEALRDKEARIQRLMDANIIGIFFGDVDGHISDANDAFLQISGYSREEVLAPSFRWTDITPSQYKAVDRHACEELRMAGRCTPYEKEFIRKDGSRIPVLAACALIEGSQDEGVSFVLDLTERKQAEERTRHMADHDALTGLPNRILLRDRLEQAIAFAHRNRRRVAVLFVDLDHFKNINDSVGHHIGDQVLQMAAARLQACVREGDSVARLAGDEFVIVLPLLGDSSEAARVGRKALDTLARPFSIETHVLHLSGSIGISVFPDDGGDFDSLMRAADTAMYSAKDKGRGNYQFFTAALNQAADQRRQVDDRLRHALEQNEFILHYQPQVEMVSGEIFSAEALLRWQPPGKAPISCGEFIANAEDSGLIVPIGEWALRQACRQLKSWRDAGHGDLTVAVNLSPRQLEHADFCDMVGQILDEAGIPASALQLEITEGILMHPSDFNLAALTRLSDMGIRLSVDDFGTGYSSLAYLQRFPVHGLKIDQSFVRDIGEDPKDTALVAAIIAMAASLQLDVIAEGVETQYQARFLLGQGCLEAQGYYYGKAVAADAFSEVIRANRTQHRV